MKNPMFRFLLVLTIASNGGFQIWRTIFNNFAVEISKVDGAQMGIINSAREIPGFLAFAAIYVILVIKEYRLAALSILLLGVGILLTGYMPSYAGLIFTTIVMSVGFHYFETTNQSLTIQYFDKKLSSVVMGRLRGATGLSSLVATGMVYLLMYYLNYAQTFLVSGLLVALIGIWALFENPTDKNIVPQAKKIVLKKKYWVFYILTCLSGARRQIFTVFAIFLMVEHFRFSVSEVTTLFMINNVVNFFLGPAIGKAINSWGERKLLSIEYVALIAVFVGYALIDSKLAIGILYVVDSLFFNFDIAIRTYFQKIGEKADFASTMAVGFTINHIIAVALPAIGGYLWLMNYQYPFWIGAVLSVAALGFAQVIKIEHANEAEGRGVSLDK
ncbi:MAG: hypothetical protein A2504_01650 [Bdellovibrionales bacterium RIFOXYD12_FULL_39_22]|nr:MAG: hypothetical protein A2385_04175 [Bdellovibrionales bacterium RIFOXYB1_FULL_39_21]OFZ42418.1 MAG: hypothetical protein A2485_15320 [Bdellovibrionales bacterium RIFOXYC12_FULL_39_17]OFZ46370.1 MAG: hypothetical protein A2404_13695 [Bdellovibrionales bacterium RIFOXYC1_FULL_39_130]OFZ75263.1 MAG: hypothetical protein A2560_15750 [Bdellovibrionales bacterium RIFOXYD1_FULL_39_84]OFZ93257.1 MAG: hypothetical protein A2504_01650 [Bdellovibrionales bacterium RIFOXYD12_FULL_39_22]